MEKTGNENACYVKVLARLGWAYVTWKNKPFIDQHNHVYFKV